MIRAPPMATKPLPISSQSISPNIFIATARMVNAAAVIRSPGPIKRMLGPMSLVAAPIAARPPATPVKPLASSSQLIVANIFIAAPSTIRAPARISMAVAMNGSVRNAPCPPTLVSRAMAPTSWPIPTEIAVMALPSCFASICENMSVAPASATTAAAIKSIV